MVPRRLLSFHLRDALRNRRDQPRGPPRKNNLSRSPGAVRLNQVREATSSARPLDPPTGPLSEVTALGDPELRRSLVRVVRSRVPEREVEDIVQETLADAIVSRSAPRDPATLRHWLGGIARHKVIDFHRRACREELSAVPETGATSPDDETADLLRWAERSLPGGKSDRQTFSWLLREGEGEKLEAIAESEQLPAERVRQRVARLRRHLRDRWASEARALGALVGLGALLGLVFLLLRSAPVEVVREASRPLGRRPRPASAAGETERARALELCLARQHRACLEGLDRAAQLDPDGDQSDRVKAARREAERALAPAPPPSAPAPPPPGSAAPGATRFGKVTGGNGARPRSDTAPTAPHRCICTRGDPLCGCF
jgi:DNA-directed RNA polymerase specialized sigma24 family protein